MRHFIVSYDLHQQRNYRPVWAELESWGATRLLESLWVVSLENTPMDLRDALRAIVDGDDSIAVVEIKTGSGWAALRAKPEGVAWLRTNIQA